jgi:hypothetical protein
MSDRVRRHLLDPPTWLLGAVAALLTWNVVMNPPSVGLDASWFAGITMATHEGLQFGREFIFSYGPLGFLPLPLLWYEGLGILSFLYSSSLYLGFCIALVWALRRQLPGLLALAIAFVLLAVLPLIEQALLLAVLVSLAMLEKERSPLVTNLFVVGAASFAAVEALAKLSTGPIITLVFLLALFGARLRRGQVALFLGLFVAELALFWFLTGQHLDNVGPFVENTLQIISGYSTAMMRQVDVPAWQVTVATIAAAAITIAIVIASSRASFRDQRARFSAVALVAVAGFTLFKEGVVRPDAGHLSLYFSSACVLWIALPWNGRRWLLAGLAVIALLGIPVRPTGMKTNLRAWDNVKVAGQGIHALFSSSRRQALMDLGRAGEQAVYYLDPATLKALEGHTVAVEPWETAVVWAYGLDWKPLPVFQNYSAYTSRLDRLNAEAVADPDGPERILRENPPLVYPEFETPDLDGRFAGWDPPQQARAVLCNFAPLTGTGRWEVLGRVENRCGAARPIGSRDAHYGETVPVPAPGRGEVVFVRIHGAGVGGLEKLSNLLLHARSRQIVVNGAASYRLIPETASDGLLMRGDPRLVEPEGFFSPIPQAKTIRLEGASGDLTLDFYAMKVAPPPGRPSSPGK